MKFYCDAATNASSDILLCNIPIYRTAIGAISALELPPGIIDDDGDNITGDVIQDIKEACNAQITMRNIINLGKKAYEAHSINNEIGLCPSLHSNSEFVKTMYLRKDVTSEDLRKMRARFSHQRELGKAATLRLVPLDNLWQVSADMKVHCALFLLQKANLGEDSYDRRSQWSKGAKKKEGIRGRISMLSNSVRSVVTQKQWFNASLSSFNPVM